MSRTVGAWLVAALAVAVVGFFAGRGLHSDGEEVSAFDFDAPAYGATKSIAGVTHGGFTGFGETPGLEGRTVVAGRVVAASADSLTVESQQGVRSTLRLSGGASLRRIEAAGREALRPGVTVVVRREAGSDEVAALLIVAEP